MLDVASAQWNDCDERWVENEAFGLSKSRENNSFRITLYQNDEPREVQFGVREHGTADEFCGVRGIFQQFDRGYGGFTRSRFAPTITNLGRLNAAEHRRRVTHNQALRRVAIDDGPHMRDDACKVVWGQMVFWFFDAEDA